MLKFAWVPDVPDVRDHAFTASATELPQVVDLRDKMPPVWDQKSIGSCVAQSVAAAHYYAQATPVVPSRLQIYYNSRLADGTVKSDAGTYIRTAIKVLAKQGAAPESLWPYVLSKCFTKPTAAAATAALERQALAYKRVDNTKLSDLLAALAEGLPIAFGSMLYENFYSLSKRFEVPAPKGKALGGHAMLICGYNQARKAFLVRNSWGVSWGDKGYFWMPFSYITNRNLTDDCWCLVKVEL